MTNTAKINPTGFTPNTVASFSGYQKFVVTVLAFLQFTIILDFMILSPLGAILMTELKISPSQFGIVISAYAFSAGIAGLLSAGFADRFDRKKMLLVFYAGFLLGTLFCGTAPTYELLLAARIVTGIFGGVMGSTVFAIITDLFPFEMRGRVMGIVQTAFAASQVLGIPAGLYFSNLWGWHAPFLAIVGIGAIAGLVIAFGLRPIDAHLQIKSTHSPFGHLKSTITNPRYLQAFATTALLSTGGFMLMPFGSAFTVHNLGISFDKLPMVYLITGLASIVAGPLIGRAADRYSKFQVFLVGSTLSVAMILIYTHLGVTSLPVVITVNTIMFIGISSRMISSQALMSAVPAPASRGSFMSVSSSVQQISGGIAAALAGLIVIEGADGKLQRFDILGYVVVAAVLFTVVMMRSIHRLVPQK